MTKGNLTERTEAVETRLDSLEKSVGEMSQKLEPLSLLSAMMETLKRIDTWMPEQKQSTTDLKTTVDELGKRVQVLESDDLKSQPVFPTLQSKAAAAASADGAPGVDPTAHLAPAHTDSLHPRTSGARRIDSSAVRMDWEDSPEEQRSHHGFTPRLPKSEFPKFSGDNPRWWKSACEKYFAMYNIQIQYWSDFATLHFVGNAALWLQTYEALHSVDSWAALCVAVNAKFGRDQYQQHLEALERLRQTDSVLEYHKKFEELMHHILVHNHAYDDLFFVTKFVAGLKHEIKMAIRLHKPRTVDAALSLSLSQEELLAEIQTTPAAVRHKLDPQRKFKPSYQYKGIMGAGPDKSDLSEDSSKLQAKYDALRALRRARGECFKCGEKFSPGHKCPTQIQLHILEELIEVLQLQSNDHESDEEDKEEQASPATTTEQTDLIMNISEGASKGVPQPKTIRYQALVNGKEVLILVDSGSSSNFISTEAVERLGLTPQLTTRAQVMVADGNRMLSDKLVAQVPWLCQNHTFMTDLRVIPLGCYDIILGMAWLEDHSPMWVDWKKKRLRFSHEGRRITLQGIKDKNMGCSQVTPAQLQQMLKIGAVCHMMELYPIHEEEPSSAIPPVVVQLLDRFKDRFEEPQGLPPRRQFDHHINLLPGVQPVSIKPYRYSPQQKNEIEQQVSEMLRKGLIRPSRSPFSSPVLLVKKKNGEWRFCVDYRRLNAVTVKDNYPMPVVDELLDELVGSCWFTKLDLRSGYHQIRVAVNDEAKTAFKTHSGQFEFLVMPFGLTTAPSTFQSTMNSIFAPWIRRFVLVFVDDILIYSPTLASHLEHLKIVLEVLQQHQFFINHKKCSFAQEKLEYLGHIISSQGVQTDSTKISAVQNWPQPSSVKNLRGFFGISGLLPEIYSTLWHHLSTTH